ncbi:hypothetical protein M2352_001179 [Azospirillum fermentarium]|uniref:hypothetical protein n=1 Tax=Azospirillum fermentarium TaxID=1233114 RepID=UPI002226E4C9|nr:hypothetical protein [Azospirillum fermentarium]MCW2245588.1 hypothetical protein [Azospirillum fermentarium]
MLHPEALEPIVTFLRGIGMAVEYGDKAHNGFLPGVNILAGVIHIDPDTLVSSGDVLHEAGHIVTVPRRHWPRLNTDLQVDIEALLAQETGPDGAVDPDLNRAARMGEAMAQAWSYAAARHLDQSPGVVFFPGSYKHTDYEGDHPMVQWLERGTHYGPLSLAETGMTGFSGVFGQMYDNGLPAFPHMTRWTLD